MVDLDKNFIFLKPKAYLEQKNFYCFSSFLRTQKTRFFKKNKTFFQIFLLFLKHKKKYEFTSLYYDA